MLMNYKQAMKNGLKVDNCPIRMSRKRGRKRYYDIVATFDIEVTNYKTDAMEYGVGIPYFWTMCIEGVGDYSGRTLEEYKEFVEYLKATFRHATLVIYVHNLAYEWQFIRKQYEWDKVFLVKRRKPLTATTDNIEFRCSYLLFNKSLRKTLEDSGTKLQKLEYNYDKLRFPWEELHWVDQNYCYVDSKGLLQAIRHALTENDDNITTIPLTSTGYVRRDLRRSETQAEKTNIKQLSIMDTKLYNALKKSFVGGNTHANRFYSGEILEDIYCYDISSSYPHVQVTCKYPISPFKEVKLDKFSRMNKNMAYALKVKFDRIRLKDQLDPMPTIGVSRCEDVKSHHRDNGRVLNAETLTMWMTDVEYSIIKNHYKWDSYEILEAHKSLYGDIPDGVKACIYKYYVDKCTLKGVDDYAYKKAKELLNSIYGMSAFDVGKLRVEYINGEYQFSDETIEMILQEANDNKNPPPEPYCWGVWTTAHARKHLDDLIVIVGDRFVYCDTDSVYTFGKIEEIEAINTQKRKLSEQYKVVDGNTTYYLGIWELDKICKRFITHGAKKYCYEEIVNEYDENGQCWGVTKTRTVTAGVGKSAGVKNIEDYQLYHTFRNATLHATYNDEEQELTIQGRTIMLGTNTYLEPADYTLGLSDDYAALIQYLRGDGYEQVLYA